MLPEIFLRIVAGIVLLAANGFFVTTEFALTRVRQFPETDFTGHPGLARAWEMTDELEVYLSGCQLGITISSVGLGLVAEPAVTRLLGHIGMALGLVAHPHTTLSVIVGIILINLTHVVFAEQVPTYLGVERARFIAKHCSRPLYVWTKVLGPVIRGADWVAKRVLGLFGVTITRSWTEEDHAADDAAPETPQSFADIRREMGSLLRGTALSRERQREILNALDIGRLPVKDIMIPAGDIRALDVQGDVETTLTTMRNAPHTRYPLQDGETYIGLVYSSAVVQDLDTIQTGEKTIEDVAVGLPTISPNTPVSAVIDQFQAESQELALVTDAAETPVHESNVLGLVTATDAFEAITGDLEDPFDTDDTPA